MRDKVITKERMTEAFKLLDDIKKQLTEKTLNGLLMLTGFILIICLVVFGWLWKIPFMLKLSFIVCLIFLIAFLALKYYFYPHEVKKEVKKDNKTWMDNLPTSQEFNNAVLGNEPNNNPSKKSKTKDSNFGLLSAEEYNKNVAKGLGFA